MKNQNLTVEKAEIQQIAEVLAIFQKLPENERLAIQYYIKGRIDALTGNVEIPVEFTKNAKGRKIHAAVV